MRRLFQTEWHSIPFSSFTEMRRDRLPDTDFYKKFYASFFSKYQSASALDTEWIQFKTSTVSQLIKRLNIGKTDRILSVSCGIGLMEMKLLDLGYTSVEVTEVSAEPLLWLNKVFRPERMHIGPFPNMIPNGRRYDWIMMSIIDYLFNEEELPAFLSTASAFLSETGICTLIFIPEGKYSTLDRLKDHLKTRYPQLERLGFVKPSQFWGYLRTLDEIRFAIERGGHVIVDESIINTNTRWEEHQLTFKRRMGSVPS